MSLELMKSGSIILSPLQRLEIKSVPLNIADAKSLSNGLCVQGRFGMQFSSLVMELQ